MKLQSNILLENLTVEEIKNLVTTTQETIAHDLRKSKKRIFTAAEFYQIQKRKRRFSIRRYSIV